MSFPLAQKANLKSETRKERSTSAILDQAELIQKEMDTAVVHTSLCEDTHPQSNTANMQRIVKIMGM